MMKVLFSIRSLMMALLILGLSGVCFGQVAVGVVVSFAPPELPVYEQPLCPGEGYIWTPGYWAWDADGDDYYWVPGTWVLVPQVGFFWTPGYWAWGGSGFVFYSGYWGPVVGFYGGINYGYGYFGRGYEGGRWDGGRFYYNRSVNNINVTEIHNVYNTTVINNTTTTRVSYNGGNGGINARPTPQEEAAARERHIPPVAAQVQHMQAARTNQELRASVNHGKPPVAATPKPAAFSDRGVVPAKEGGRYNPPPARTAGNAAHPGTAPSTVIHPNDYPPYTRPAAPNTGNPTLDKKYQQEQEKLYAQQEKERQKLQQQQDKQHQQMMQQKADEAKKQQMEQQHQQQTQQLQQKHAQQQQQMQQRHQPPPPPPHQQPPPPHPSKPPTGE
jgi:hypothetical protein